MRDDLNFLYQKAMRSKDLKFINEVISIIADHKQSSVQLYRLVDRAEFIHNMKFDKQDFRSDKFSFMIGDSQMGENWYRNK